MHNIDIALSYVLQKTAVYSGMPTSLEIYKCSSKTYSVLRAIFEHYVLQPIRRSRLEELARWCDEILVRISVHARASETAQHGGNGAERRRCLG